MLAYVFWHRSHRPVPAESYEAALNGFHRVLSTNGPPGFEGSSTFRVASIPWLHNEPGYEDWYLLRDSAGLDILERAAVAGARGTAHDSVAAYAAEGQAGLYRPRRPASRDLPGRTTATWLSKPAGVAYADFLEALDDAAPSDHEIWQRALVLGPSAEFCLIGPAGREEATAWPGEVSCVLTRDRIWP